MSYYYSIKYVFIGNTLSQKEICDMNVGQTDKELQISIKNEATQIFQQYSKSQNNKIESKNKVRASEGNFYFTIYPNNTFYLILAEHKYSEENVFNIISEIDRQSIYKLANQDEGLSKSGKNELMKLIRKYDEDNNSTLESAPTKLTAARGELDCVKVEMQSNIKKVISNVEDITIVEEKASRISDGTLMYRNLAGEFRRTTWWNGVFFKYALIGILLVIAFFFIYWAFSD